MNNTMLIGLSRQVALQRELDVVANNVANVTTNGFRRRGAAFAEHIMPVARGDHMASANRALSFVVDAGTVLDTSPGTIEKTGNPLDVALRGEGFFTVQTPQGERYTRNGALSLNANGDLVTMDGHPILTEQGVLTFTPADGAITISGDGTVSTQQGVRGKLKLVRFADPQKLESLGGNLLAAATPPEPVGQTTRIESGAVERSNVSPVAETARLIEVTRAYSSLASMIQRSDDLRRTALTRLAETL